MINGAKVRRGLAAVMALGAFGALGLSSSEVSAAKGTVTETSPQCQLATAVLLVGNNADAETHWARIKSFFEAKRVWTVGEAKPGFCGEVGLVQWDITHPYNNGPNAAFSARSGCGATANNVAKAFSEVYADLQPAPIVFCGESVMLGNPSSR